METQSPDHLTVKDVAHELQVTCETVKDWFRKPGRALRPIRINQRVIRIKRSELESFLNYYQAK